MDIRAIQPYVVTFYEKMRYNGQKLFFPELSWLINVL